MLDVVHNVMLFTPNIVLSFEKLFKMLVLKECFKRGFMRSYSFPNSKGTDILQISILKTEQSQRNIVAKGLINSSFEKVICGFSRRKCLHLALQFKLECGKHKGSFISLQV